VELDVFRLYLDEIGRHPLLTREDEIALSRAYHDGLRAGAEAAALPAGDPRRPALERAAARGKSARRRMIEGNLRLVVSIARRFTSTGLPLADLVQEGNLGLLRAVEKFDWRLGFKFSTYATWWIRQAIARGAAERGARAIRLPVHVDERVGRLRRAQSRLRESLGREPTDDELGRDLDISTLRMARLRDASRSIESLDSRWATTGRSWGTSSRTGRRPTRASWRRGRPARRRWSRRSRRCPNASGGCWRSGSGSTPAPPTPSRRSGGDWLLPGACQAGGA